jgi:hypothetical protein
LVFTGKHGEGDPGRSTRGDKSDFGKSVTILKSVCFRLPMDWNMVNANQFRIYQTDHAKGLLPRITMLLQVDGSGHAGEGFRFTVESDRIDADIWSRDIFEPAELGGYRLRYQLRGADIELRPNTLSSKWEDLETLIGRGIIDVQRPEGGDSLTAEFRQTLAAEREEHPGLGAAVRWAVQGSSTRGELRLVLQGLPATARFLRATPLHTADEAATVTLDTFEATTNNWDSLGSRGR